MPSGELGPSVQPVAVLSQVPPPVHGSTIMTQAFLRALEDEGIGYTLISRAFSSEASDVGKFALAKLVRVPSLLRRVWSATRGGSASVFVLFITNRPGSFLVDALVCEILRIRRSTRVDYVHTLGFRQLASRGPLWRALVRRTLGNAAATVCLSPALTDDVTWVGRLDVRVIPNTLLSSPPAAGESNPVRDIVFMSNLIPEKGALDFLRIAEDVAKVLPDYRYVLAGGTRDSVYLGRIRDASCRPEIQGKVEIVGHLDSAAKWDLLSNAALLVFPSRYRFEAQPLTVIEALSVGTPVVAYDIGATRDMIDSTVGALVEPDPSRAAAAVISLLTDHSGYSSMRVSARRRYTERFSPLAYAARWGSLLRELAGGEDT